MSAPGLRLYASRATRLARSSPVPTWTRYRSVHHRRELQHSMEEGFGSFLPPAALRLVAVDYQDGLLQRLNEQVKDTPEANKSVVQTVINTATDRTRTATFNYASLALNNSFFLDSLRPLPAGKSNHEDLIDGTLMARIRDSFRDLAGLKSQFTAVASGMAGSGYVWLVADADGKMAVLPTFAAGTLLVSAREQTSPRDGANALVIGEESKVPAHGTGTPRMLGSGSQAPASPASGLVHPMSSPTAPQGSRALSTSPVVRTNGATSLFDGDNSASYVSPIFDSIRKKSNLRAMGETIYPLFCVSMHEHCWMSAGFGVWGKEAWLEHFWNVLDWEKVSRTYTGGKRK